MKQFILLLTMAFVLSCSSTSGEKPTKEDVTKVMKANWEKEKTNFEAKSSIIINDITFGISEQSNYSMQFDGVPKGALVTHAKIDFTQQIFYTDKTHEVRRVMTAFVYKDQFGQWAVMNNGTKYIN